MNKLTIFPEIEYRITKEDARTLHEMLTWVVCREQNGNYVKTLFSLYLVNANTFVDTKDSEKYLLNNLFIDIYKMAVFGTYDRSLVFDNGVQAWQNATEEEVKRSMELYRIKIIYK